MDFAFVNIKLVVISNPLRTEQHSDAPPPFLTHRGCWACAIHHDTSIPFCSATNLLTVLCILAVCFLQQVLGRNLEGVVNSAMEFCHCFMFWPRFFTLPYAVC